MEGGKEDTCSLSSSFSCSSLSSSSLSFDHHHLHDRPSSSSSPPCSGDDYDGDDHVTKVENQWLRFVDVGEDDKGDMQWNIDVAEEWFDHIAASSTGAESPPDTIDVSSFCFCIGLQETPEFGRELVEALRGRKTHHDLKHINKRELFAYWHRLTHPSYLSRLQLFFDMCDKDMDGRITTADFKQMIILSASTNKMNINEMEAENFGTLIMEEMDVQQNRYVEINQLKDLLKATLAKGYLSSEQESITISTPPISERTYKLHHYKQQQDIMSLAEILFRNYWRRGWIITIWLITCISLFAWKFRQYEERVAFQVMGYCLSTAKGAAETLKLNMALILLPVCRNLVTWLRRSHCLCSFVPFNDNINFHKLIAGGIVIGVILHGGTHLTCDFPRIVNSNPIIFQTTFGTAFGNKQPTYLQVLGTTEGTTGIIMVILMAIAFSLATKMPRRRSSSLPRPLQQVTGYNTFWYSHHLLIVVYVLLVVHSMFLFLTNNFVEKTTWMYLAVPVLLYAGERICRSIRSEIYEVDVLQANMHPGKVVYLKLSKPAKFTSKSGMYIYIKCPQISPFEWHPFSLTSGPNDDHISVHIRTLGDWSNHIHTLFQEAIFSKPLDYPKVYIDGPYGAASQDHVKYDIVVLIGLGIGVTPFISILKDIGDKLHNPPTNHVDDVEQGVPQRPLKAYLYWVTREHGSLGWFKDDMNEICKLNQKQKVIEMHNFSTSVYQSGDARSIMLSIIQALYYSKTGIDVFSQTPVRTHFSRPNWFKIFSNLALRHAGSRIGVFFCGASNLGKELKDLCTKFSTKTTTRFVFHKENY